MTDTAGPTPEDIDRFNAAAQQYADNSGKTFEDARDELGALLENMTKDPVGTALYFARLELAAAEKVEAIAAAVENLDDRVAHLEKIGGGEVVGPGGGSDPGSGGGGAATPGTGVGGGGVDVRPGSGGGGR